MIINSYSFVSGGGATYNGQNAADPVNEVNGTANTTVSNATIESSTEQSEGGSTWSLKHIKSTAASSNIRLQTQNITNNDNVTVTGYVYWPSTQSDGNVFAFLADGDGWDVSDSDATNPNNTWNSFTVTATATQDNPDILFQSTGTTVGLYFYVDNIVVTIN